jgi:thiol-disulfide isomerase/thioredoxin
MSPKRLLVFSILAALLLGCGLAPDEVAAPDWEGRWRAVLQSPGGELPFELRIRREAEGDLGAVAVTGGEILPFSSVEINGREIGLAFDWYDSSIQAELDPSGDSMAGQWRKRSAEGHSELAFVAERGMQRRFRKPSELGLPTGSAQALPSVSGIWDVVFEDDSSTESARGEFRQDGVEVMGTFLTPTGDYRYLEGTYEQGLLRLSTFDGAHAFLFQAEALADGTLRGDFWSRDSYHATWTASRGAGKVPDAWSLVGLQNAKGEFNFRFPDLDGRVVSLDDPLFAEKVVLVNIFGSWCPNCNDEAPLLASWARRYRDRGLEVIGLGYELTGDHDRDRRQLRRFRERHGIDYPLLLAGTSDKTEAAATLPDLTSVVAYPTTVFLDRSGKVRSIHSGFSGPGTGAHHEALVAEMESLIEELLDEPAPATKLGTGTK